MKKFILLAFAILCVLLLFLFLKPKNKKPEVVTGIAKRDLSRVIKPERVLNDSIGQTAYDLLNSNDSLFIMGDPNYYLADPNMDRFSKVSFSQPISTLYYYGSSNSAVTYYDVDKKRLFYSRGDTLRAKTLQGNPGRAIFLNGLFYYDLATMRVEDDTVQIHAWNPVTGKDSVVINFNNLFASELKGNRSCRVQMLEGIFFNVDSERWGFIFYNAGKFIIGDRNQYKIYNTIDNKGFKNYRRKSVKMSSTQTAYVCEAESDAFTNFGAAVSNNNLYILSGVVDINKGLHTPIDVYDIATFKYKYTLNAPCKSKSDYATSIAVVKNKLYLLYTESKLLMFNIPGE